MLYRTGPREKYSAHFTLDDPGPNSKSAQVLSIGPVAYAPPPELATRHLRTWTQNDFGGLNMIIVGQFPVTAVANAWGGVFI